MREFPTAQSDIPLKRDVYSVEKLNKVARQLVESRFAQVWVEGELSNLSAPSSGHLYFTLKDHTSQIRCALFRNRRTLFDYTPTEGAQVLLRARLTIYEPRGDLQLVVQYIEPAGEGALREKFERLKASLQKEGLFDAERKQPIPMMPRRIGVITSPTGAAVRDIVTTCHRRFPAIPLIIYPTPVQGISAPDGIINALQQASQRAECDVLILARGGGSLEDLWAFNEERTARAIADCDIPIVSGIGHEIDFTIADFVADHRAATPTAAAELVVPEAASIARHLRANAAQISAIMTRRIEQATQRNDLLAHRLIHPTRRYTQARHRLQLIYSRLSNALRHDMGGHRQRFNAHAQCILQHNPRHQLVTDSWRLQSAHKRLGGISSRLTAAARRPMLSAMARLNGVSPLATLQRGYAMVTNETGKVVTAARQVRVGEKLDVRLAQGELICRVEDKTR